MPTNSERWQQVKSVLDGALQTDPPNRSSYLEKACAGDPTLRSELEDLLAIENQADSSLLNTPAISADTLPELDDVLNGESASANLRVGRRVGPYQIVDEIGSGGMGEVYRAFRADDQYQKEVAIKLVRAGQDSRFVISRFKNERQVLASLDHPNIARLLDGGTAEDGSPYFVMELIEGKSFYEYCDVRRLSVHERLKLFLQVCSAVQHAHQRLIIHRDLKPSNILVMPDGVPKLLDFGIAKILNSEAMAETAEQTMSGFRLLTPAYASPEQIKGEAITTASDVYSLGVLLYELLTGHRPYRVAGSTPHEIARAVCEEEPTKPSRAVWRSSKRETSEGTVEITPASVSAARGCSPERLSRQLRGDLDNIVLRAVEKQPPRRYPSVEQLAGDVQRYLEKLPVSATKGTFRYRASRFMVRHKAGVAVSFSLSITLLAGLGTTLYEARAARLQQLRAEQRFNDVRELANSLLFEVHDAIEDLPGSTPVRKMLVDRALRYLDRLSHDARSDPSLQRELGMAYERVGTVQGNPFGANLGDTQGALRSYGRSLEIRRTLLETNPTNVEDRVAVARTERLMAAILSNRGDRDALPKLQNASAIAEQSLRIAPNNANVFKEMEADYYLLAIMEDSWGNYPAAAEYLQKALPVSEENVTSAPGERGLRRELARVEAKLGYELARLGFRKDGVRHAQRGIQILESLSANTTDAESRRWLGMANWILGDILMLDGNVAGALPRYEEQRRINVSLAYSDPTNAVVQYDLACATARVGNVRALGGDRTAGVAMLRHAASMLRTQLARDPVYTEPRFCLAATLVWMGEALSATRAEEQALSKYKEALEIWQALTLRFEGTGLEADLAVIHERMGSALLRMNKIQEASREFNRAVAIAEAITKTDPKILEAQYALADGYSGVGDSFRALASDTNFPLAERVQRWAQARDGYQQSAETWRNISNPGARTPVGWACGNRKRVGDELARCNSELVKLAGRIHASAD